MTVAGVLLAAGGGRRYGTPKALADTGDGPWVLRAVTALAAGGCAPVLVVVGAEAERVQKLLPPSAIAVPCPEWSRGLSTSLQAGLAAVAQIAPQPIAALIHLVDLPDIGPDVIARVVGLATADALIRARYGNIPGHPVLLGSRWWAEAAQTATGDRGAGDFLIAHPDLRLVDCADLAGGADVDCSPPEPAHA